MEMLLLHSLRLAYSEWRFACNQPPDQSERCNQTTPGGLPRISGWNDRSRVRRSDAGVQRDIHFFSMPRIADCPIRLVSSAGAAACGSTSVRGPERRGSIHDLDYSVKDIPRTERRPMKYCGYRLVRSRTRRAMMSRKTIRITNRRLASIRADWLSTRWPAELAREFAGRRGPLRPACENSGVRSSGRANRISPRSASR